MGKKSSNKRAKRDFRNLEKNEIKTIEIRDKKEISVQNINLKELSKFEKIKKFRNLENINITYGDKEKDKFKDFQELYTLITNIIEEKNRKCIFSEKDEIFYILPYKFITTKKIEGYFCEEYKENQKELEKISKKLIEKRISFDFPTEDEIKLLDEINFIGSGDWLYKLDGDTINKGELDYYSLNSFEYDEDYENNLLGIYRIVLHPKSWT